MLLLFLYEESKLFEIYVKRKKNFVYEAECGCSTGVTYIINIGRTFPNKHTGDVKAYIDVYRFTAFQVM